MFCVDMVRSSSSSSGGGGSSWVPPLPVSASGAVVEAGADVVGKWTEVEQLEPPPSHTLSSPLIQAFCTLWLCVCACWRALCLEFMCECVSMCWCVLLVGVVVQLDWRVWKARAAAGRTC